MGRSVAVILALLVIFSAAAVAAPVSFNSSGAVALDTISVNITAPHQNEYIGTPYANIAWNATDSEHNITRFLVYLDSLSDPLVTTVQSINLTGLADGPHYVVIRAYDDVGGTAEDSVFFFIDTVPPALRIITPTDGGYLNYSDVTVNWLASDNVSIAYFEAWVDNEPHVNPIGFDQTSLTFADLADGHHHVTVVAHSWGGQSTLDTVSFDIDTTYPTLEIISPLDGSGFGNPGVAVEWSGYDAGGDIQGYQIWVDGVYTTTAVPTEDQFFLNYSDGYHNVKIVAVDIANSTATDEVTFLVDTVAPGIVNFWPEGDDVPVDTTIAVNFTKAMDHEQTNLTITGVSGTVTWDHTILIFHPSAPLSYGKTYTVTMNGKDLVGTPISHSWSFTTTDMGTVSGTVVDNNGNPISGARVTLDGNATFITAADGTYSFYAHAGQHNITITKSGWVDQSEALVIVAGQTTILGSTQLNPTNPLALFGMLAAVAGVVIVGILYVISRRKKDKGPPSRSWKGGEPRKRTGKKKDWEDEEDDETL